MKHKYQINLYWSNDDNAVIAEVPGLEGCMADGANYNEALANIEVVIEQWVQTAKELKRTIPIPKGKLTAFY
jgi:predicted RNase H-like HicB family nuclease